MIVCLGWGSLIWDPRNLDLKDNRPEAWRSNGPRLPIEYARISEGQRLTLVIAPWRLLLSVLWNELKGNDVDHAVRSLREREGTHTIGAWKLGKRSEFPYGREIGRWGSEIGASAVIWTALPPKFGGRPGRIPSRAEVITYLRPVEGVDRTEAERYIRRTPAQIRTRYRAAIESALGWTHDPNF